ncbi:mitogen-activated protein kinase kinase 3 [Fagus crenata]
MFCSDIDACLQKDADARPTSQRLLSHPSIKKYEHSRVDLAAFVQSVFDLTQRMKDLADLHLNAMLKRAAFSDLNLAPKT